MAITSINTPAGNNPQVFAGAQAAELAINKQGGINGHPIQILTCNDQYDANVAAACARQAASEGVVATVGTDSTLGGSIDPILEQAGIASVGNLPVASADNTSSISFPFEAGAGLQYIGNLHGFAERNITKIGVAVLSATAATAIVAPVIKLLQDGAVKTKSGKPLQFVGQTQVSLTATDFSPYVQALKTDGAQGVVMVMTPAGGVGMINTAQRLGADLQFAAIGASYQQSDLEAMSGADQGVQLAASLPNPRTSTSFAGIKQFQKEMAAADRAGIANATGANLSDAALEAWLAVYAVRQVASTIKKPITNTTFLEAMNTVKSVDMLGIIPSWDPSKPGPNGYPRISNSSLYFLTVKGTSTYLVSPKTWDVAPLVNSL